MSTFGDSFNFVIRNEWWSQKEEDGMFQAPQPAPRDSVEVVPETADMYDLLVKTGAFSSKNDARKNWKRSGKEVPNGFSLFNNIGHKRLTLCIWKPFDVGDCSSPAVTQEAT